MKQLIKDHKKFALIDIADENLNKIKGKEPYPGAKVSIHWNNDYKIIDQGYAVLLPICDEYLDTDYFIHVPNPYVEKEASEGVWIHLHDLLINKYVKKIVFK